MKRIEVTLHFSKPPCFGWIGLASTAMEARSKARQDAIASGFKDEVKRVEVEIKP